MFKATSGPAALELLVQHDFALAVIAAHAPAMNGFELAEIMRDTERSRSLPIIFIMEANRNEALPLFRGSDAGGAGLLSTPVNEQILRQKAEIFSRLDRQRLELALAVQARE